MVDFFKKSTYPLNGEGKECPSLSVSGLLVVPVSVCTCVDLHISLAKAAG